MLKFKEDYLKEYIEFPILTDNQAKQEAEKMWEELKITHPYIARDKKDYFGLNNRSVGISVRALRSDKPNRTWKNHTVFNFSQNEYERFEKFCVGLFKVQNTDTDKKGKTIKVDSYYVPFCLYHSLYAYDYDILAINQEGKEHQKEKQRYNKIAKNNADVTQSIFLDFDDISEEQFLEIHSKFIEMGLEMYCRFSGNGYQCYVLLDKPTTDLSVQKQFCQAVESLGFPVDTKTIDCARLSRMGLFNSKCFIKKTGTVKKVATVATTERRYSLQEVFSILGVEYVPNQRPLNTKRFTGDYEAWLKYPYQDEHEGSFTKAFIKQEKEYKEAEKKKAKGKVAKIDDSFHVQTLETLYPMLKINDLQPMVKNQLKGLREGFADISVFFLTCHLKSLGYNKNTVKEAMCILSDLDTYNYAWDHESVIEKVNHAWTYAHSNPSDMTKLESKFGRFHPEEFNVEDAHIIKIPSKIFNDPKVIKELKTNPFILWINFIRLDSRFRKKLNGSTPEFTTEQISKATRKAIKSTRSNLDILSNVGMITKKKALNKRAGGSCVYYLNPFYTQNCCKWVQFTRADIQMYVRLIDSKKLKIRDFIVLCYVLSELGGDKQKTLNQGVIAQDLGLTRRHIVTVLNNLHEMHILEKKDNGIGQLCTYAYWGCPDEDLDLDLDI